MRLLYVMDPLETMGSGKDTTFVHARRAARRARRPSRPDASKMDGFPTDDLDRRLATMSGTLVRSQFVREHFVALLRAGRGKEALDVARGMLRTARRSDTLHPASRWQG